MANPKFNRRKVHVEVLVAFSLATCRRRSTIVTATTSGIGKASAWQIVSALCRNPQMASSAASGWYVSACSAQAVQLAIVATPAIKYAFPLVISGFIFKPAQSLYFWTRKASVSGDREGMPSSMESSLR